jgi:hypothetical protein
VAIVGMILVFLIYSVITSLQGGRGRDAHSDVSTAAGLQPSEVAICL